MTEETDILFNRAYTVVFEFKNMKILLKMEMKSINKRKMSSVLGAIKIHCPSYGLLVFLIFSWTYILDIFLDILDKRTSNRDEECVKKDFYSFRAKLKITCL